MKRNLKPKEYTRRRHVLTAIKWCIALVLTVGVGLFNYFIPFRTLLPATQIKARAEGELRVHYLAVGQADCSVVEFPDGELLVIDGGDGSWASRNLMIKYLNGLNATAAPKISYVVTHADGDHYGGIEELIRIFGGDRLYLPSDHSDSGAYRAMLAQANSSRLTIDVMSRYDTIKHPSGAYVSCLSPLAAAEGESNSLSTVLYLSYANRSALFCGDIDAERERILLEEYLTDGSFFDGNGCFVRLENLDLLKVAHHGSGNSSSEEWLNLLRAKRAVVSCGQGNAYSHPALGALTRLKNANPDCEIYRTDELGTVVATVTNTQITVCYDGLE